MSGPVLDEKQQSVSVVERGMAVRGVTLYDNGYAVFRREAEVTGSGHVDLYFPAEQVQSVLESLQFSGEAGKKVGNIAYEATTPSSGIHIAPHNPLVGLLRSLTGVRVSLQEKARVERVEGRVLGVEKLATATGDYELQHVSLVLDGGGVRTLSLQDVASLHVLESQVQHDIAFSLDLVQNSSKGAVQKLSVFYSDVEGPATLTAQYGLQVREWKSSYRMQLSENSARLCLQGLAVVENTLDEDWKEIDLTLVVGAPVIRKEADMRVDHGELELSVKTLDGSFVKVRADPKDSVLEVKEKIGRKKGLDPSSFKLVFSGKSVEDGRLLSDYNMRNFTTLHMMRVEGSRRERGIAGGGGGEGEAAKFVMAAQENLSYYHIPMKVTAQRKQKAIVQLLKEQLDGQRVVLYDETICKGNPMLAILFANTTGRTLEGGSLQVSCGEVFLGQGTLPTLHAGDESPPVPYAVELACEITKESNTSYLKPHLVTISDGTVSISCSQRERTVYTIRNKSDRELDFLLNHLFLEECSLVVQKSGLEEDEPVDISDRFYQFRFAVCPNVEKKFAVLEEMDDVKTHDIRFMTTETLESWVKESLIDKKVELAIRSSFNMRKDIDTIMKTVYKKEGEVLEVMGTQERLRKNISALEHHECAAERYINSLSQEEDKLKNARQAIKQYRHRRALMERELTSTIKEISYKQEFKRDS